MIDTRHPGPRRRPRHPDETATRIRVGGQGWLTPCGCGRWKGEAAPWCGRCTSRRTNARRGGGGGGGGGGGARRLGGGGGGGDPHRPGRRGDDGAGGGNAIPP